MPSLTIDSITVEVPENKRLINAITDEGKSDQLHSCGGNAACTTCRVQFISGEPTKMTQAEKDLLIARGLKDGIRLSCQMNCDHDMEIKIISRLAGSSKKDAGARPKDQIEPPPVWIEA
jgi:ferredoxin